MDNTGNREQLRAQAQTLGIELSDDQVGALLKYAAELLRWNAKVNLTAITAPAEVIEKHLVDSIAALPEVRGAGSLLDLGAGAGLPGIPLKILLPELDVQLVDAVAKKVGFIKSASAVLGLRGLKGIHARANREPAKEGIAPAEVVTARALMELEELAELSAPYLLPGGRVVALMGVAPSEERLAKLAERGWITSVRRFQLPASRSQRAIAVLRRTE